MSDPDLLDPDEAFRFVMVVHAVMLAYRDSYYLGEEGALDQNLHHVIGATRSAVRSMPGFHWYGAQRRSCFLPGFRRFVDELDATAEAEPLYRK